MELEQQKHYYLHAQHHYLDIQVNDLETGISFYMHRIKEGLYRIKGRQGHRVFLREKGRPHYCQLQRGHEEGSK